MPQDFWLATFDDNHYCNRLDSIRFSLIIWVIICRVKIANGEFHDSHKRSSIAATVHFPETKVSTINPNIQNSPHSPKWRNMTNVIIKWTKNQKETQSLHKKSNLSPICPPSKVPEKYPATIWIVEKLSSQCIPSSERLVCSGAAACTCRIGHRAHSRRIRNVIVLA